MRGAKGSPLLSLAQDPLPQARGDLRSWTLAAAAAGPVGALRRAPGSGARGGSWGEFLCGSSSDGGDVLVLFVGAGEAARRDSQARGARDATAHEEEKAAAAGGGEARSQLASEASAAEASARQAMQAQAAMDTVNFLYMLHCKLVRIVDLREPRNSFLLQYLRHAYRARAWQRTRERSFGRYTSAERGGEPQDASELEGEAAAATELEDAPDSDPALSVVDRATGSEELLFGWEQIRDFFLARLALKARRMARAQQEEFLGLAGLVEGLSVSPSNATQAVKAPQQPSGLPAVGHPLLKHWWDPLGLSFDLYVQAACGSECPATQQVLTALSKTGLSEVVRIHECGKPTANIPPVIGPGGLSVLPALGIGNRLIYGVDQIARFLHALGSFVPTPKLLRNALKASERPLSSTDDVNVSTGGAGFPESLAVDESSADDETRDVWPSPGDAKARERSVLRLPPGLDDATLVCNTLNLASCQTLLDWLTARGLFNQVKKNFVTQTGPVQYGKTSLKKDMFDPLLVREGVILAQGLVGIPARIAAAFVAADVQSWSCAPVVVEAFLVRGRPTTQEAERIVAAMARKGMGKRVRIKTFRLPQRLAIGGLLYPIPLVVVPGIAQFVGLDEVKVFVAALGQVVDSIP
ncbi:hypothetical protein BESB_063620 [Besnoitia besnoiti]|uniref:Uncharacterized protein n=1 Tax=Besnoitia besnoiti TaxID=94643 RepID=A0A2A9MBX1_BESBE|nr:hypothetical protein BESB_063620 [Besnoitia besnoiti]PFH35475.1 hypothetical protein BESB_063620 [Besnoitia besnoiti]